MSSGARVSAFAKRRKVDDGYIQSDTSSPEPASSKLDNGISKRINANVRSSKRVSRKTAIDSNGQTTKITVHEHNSFDPLVAANVVNFSGIREIEKVNDTSLKIRLSTGQKCILQGIARLWIREGTILLQGAKLSESINVYTIFGSAADELLEITAHTQIAEFQLEGIPRHDLGFPSILNIPGKLGRISRSLPESFELLETDQPSNQMFSDESASRLYEEIQRLLFQPPKLIQIAESTITKSVQDGRIILPRILIAGKRSTTTSKISTITINRLLTEHSAQHNATHVAFLDLDHISPTFACPGTISLAAIEIAILGPSFSSPLQPQFDAPNRLICSYFLGFSEQFSLSAYSIPLLQKVLAKLPKDLPLVIRVGSNFGDLQYQDLLEFATLVTVSACVYAAASRSSLLYDALQIVTNHLDGTLMQLKLSSAVSATTALEAHKLAIRSQFYLQDFINCLPQWPPLSMLTNATNKLHLSFDNNSARLSFVVIRGGVLRHEDVSEALEGSLVALVAREADKTFTLPSNEQQSDQSTGLSNEHDAIFPQFEIQMQDSDNTGSPLEYIGLALVESITDTMNSITLITNIEANQLRWHYKAGQRIGIVLEKPSIDDKFTSQILQD